MVLRKIIWLNLFQHWLIYSLTMKARVFVLQLLIILD